MDIFQFFKDRFKSAFYIYESSLRCKNGNYFFLVKDLVKHQDKKLVAILSKDDFSEEITFFETEKINLNKNIYWLYLTPLNFENMKFLMKIFKEPGISVCLKDASFGTGDRLGIVTAAHLKAFESGNIFPVLAQQSVRELGKTGRTWEDVISSAYWGCIEAGYNGFFGADADHVKDYDNLKAAARAGFLMFTIDSSDYIKKEDMYLSSSEIGNYFVKSDKKHNFKKNYLNKKIKIAGNFFEFEEDILKFLVYTYMDAVIFVSNCYELLKENCRQVFDFEVSMDEIAQPVTPIAHIFLVEEFRRLGVEFKNLALRFVGKWEKAVDYIGDLSEFENQLKIHAGIVKKIGGYKLSLHSGSDKFLIYPVFSSVNEGLFHIKTSGVSWLEAMRVVAENDPCMFREIFNFSLKNFENERVFYDVSTDITKIRDINDLSDNELVNFMNFEGARQVLHINYGAILDLKDKDGANIFKDRIYNLLLNREDEHYMFVTNQIKKHLELLNA